jgi:hypothetical protein
MQFFVYSGIISAAQRLRFSRLRVGEASYVTRRLGDIIALLFIVTTVILFAQELNT